MITCKSLGYPANTPLGVVYTPIVAVTEHHSGVHHGSQSSQDGAPAVALNVNEAQQLLVVDVLACYVASVGS